MPVELQLLKPSSSQSAAACGDRVRKLLQISSEPVSNLGGVGLIVTRLISGLSTKYRLSLACPDADRLKEHPQLYSHLEELIAIPSGKWSRITSDQFIHQVLLGNYDLIHFHGGPFSFDAHLPWRCPLYQLRTSGIPWIYSSHCAPSLTAGLFPASYPFPLKALKFSVALLSLAYLMTKSERQIFDSHDDERRFARLSPWARKKLTTI